MLVVRETVDSPEGKTFRERPAVLEFWDNRARKWVAAAIVDPAKSEPLKRRYDPSRL